MGRYGVMYNPTEPSKLDEAMSYPAVRMFAGDLTSRGHIADAGASEELAQKITLTNEPRRIITKKAADFGKHGSALGTALLPFVRTAANIAESGAERTPGLAYLINTFGDPSLRVSRTDIAVQQAMGTAVYYTAYKIGQSVDPDTAKQTKMTTLISNLGGQYAMLAGAGFIAGQSSRRGDTFGAALGKSIVDPYNGIASSIPLPTTQALVETLKPYLDTMAGKPPESKRDYIPDMAVPKILPFAETAYDKTKELLTGGNGRQRPRRPARVKRQRPAPRRRPE
jgi:hypothetical protein